MADWEGIGNMLQGVGAGFSGNLPQYMQAQTLRAEQDALADEGRRKALIRDFATGYSMLASGQTDQATQLFGNRLEQLKKLKAPDISDTQGVYDRLISGDPAKIEEARAGLQSIVEGAMVTGELGGGKQGYNSTASNQMFKDGSVLQANRDGTTTFRDPSGQLLKGGARMDALNKAIGSGVWLAGQEAGARANATEAAQTAAAGPQALNAGLGQLQSQGGIPGVIPSAADLATDTNKSKLLVDRASARLETGLTAASTLPSLYRMGELLNTVETGGFNNATAKFQSMFGVLPKDKAELQNLMGRNVLSQLKASFGGNPSEREGQFLAEIEASLSKGTGSNKATIDNAVKLLELRASNGKKAAKYLEDQDSADEIDNYMKLKLGDQSKNVPQATSDDAQALAWARANPNDPRAAAILQHAGGR